jgi:hypothetical protein
LSIPDIKLISRAQLTIFKKKRILKFCQNYFFEIEIGLKVKKWFAIDGTEFRKSILKGKKEGFSCLRL